MIVVFSNSTKNTMGGVEIFNEELEMLFLKNNIESIRIESNSHNKIFNYLIRVFFTLKLIYFNYKRTNFILLQYGNFLDILILPLLFLSFKKIKLIVHIGDSWKHINNKLLRSITNFYLKMFVNELFIITDEQRSFLKHNNITKIHTIINEKYLNKNNYPNNDYLLFLGRICKEKGIEDLISVYSNLNKKISLPILNIVGPIDSEYKIEIDKFILNEKLEKKVFIQKPVYDINKKIELIDNAKVLIYPSYADAFPLTVIETFSRKKPCFATRISETKNFICTDKFLFEPGNCLEMYNKLIDFFENPSEYNVFIEEMYLKSIKYAQGQIVYDILDEI